MADNSYFVGQGVVLEFDLTVAGAPATDSVVVTVRPPSGTPLTPAVTEAPTGVFKATVVAAQAGLWWYSAVGTNNVAVGAGSFVVLDLVPSLSASALTTILAARQFVLSNALDDSQDFRLANLINAYSRSIFSYTQREWLPQSTATRSFTYDGGGELDLAPYDVRSVSAVTFYTDLPSAQQISLVAPGAGEGDWRLEPTGGTLEGTYLRMIFSALVLPPVNLGHYAYYDHRVAVTGAWGIAADLTGVPYDVQLACLVAVADAYRNPEGFGSRSLGPLQLTEEQQTAPSGASFSAGELPLEAQGLLEDYRARTVQLY